MGTYSSLTGRERFRSAGERPGESNENDKKPRAHVLQEKTESLVVVKSNSSRKLGVNMIKVWLFTKE